MTPEGEGNLRRVRRICLAMPGATERLSHGEPTFFAGKKVFAMFANNHHNDGRVAVWAPAEEGAQGALMASAPAVYFRPPYVGVKGWVGMVLDEIGDEELGERLTEAWRMATAKKKPVQSRSMRSSLR